MRLQITRSKNAECFYVVKSFYENGVSSNKVVERLGNLEAVKEKAGNADPYEWAKAYVAELNRKEKEGREPVVIAKYSPEKQIDKDVRSLYNGGYLFLQQVYYELGLDRICKEIEDRYKFTYDLNGILSRLVYGRILCPSSKLSTLEYSKALIEAPSFDQQHIYRALDIIAGEDDFIQSQLYKNSLVISKRNDRILYYDCTNYFFEIDGEDELRRYGKSKEHRPDPIVQMGLFLDGDGIPLAFSIFPGSSNEQTSLKPLEKKIIKDFGKASFVVCTDAGLSGTSNRKFNAVNGRAFITTQSLRKLKGYQRDWVFEKAGWKMLGSTGDDTYDISKIKESDELLGRYKDAIFYKERWMNEDGLEQRFIVSFSVRYMLYERQVRARQYQRAQKMLERPGSVERKGRDDPGRFIRKTSATEDGEIASKASYELDEELYLEESAYDGLYGVATDLEDDAEKIVRINKNRWEIEAAFRLMKLEFKARPVYLSREERIKAHFMTCYLALTVFRYLEKKIEGDYPSEQVIDTLRKMDFQRLLRNGYVPVYTRTDITDALHDAAGFRTDYEIVTDKSMKNIIADTKKHKKAQDKTSVR